MVIHGKVIQVEKGSFTTVVMSTFGGMGKEAVNYHRRIATLISEKRNERYSDVMNYIRTRLRFCILKSVLVAIRGVRRKFNLRDDGNLKEDKKCWKKQIKNCR